MQNKISSKSISNMDKTDMADKRSEEILKQHLGNKLIEINQAFFDYSKLRVFNSKYMNSFNDYDTQKRYFEIFVCKVNMPHPQFIYTEENRYFKTESCIFSKNKLTIAFSHIRFFVIKAGKMVDTSFTSKWLNDENIKVYNYLDF